jgi:hypothetical protein
MISNKKLYWILQILGWTAYTAVQLVAGIFSGALITAENKINDRGVLFLVAEARFVFCTHPLCAIVY